MGPNCNNCVYWMPQPNSPKGQCRRFPPRARGVNVESPLTAASFWCGEHHFKTGPTEAEMAVAPKKSGRPRAPKRGAK